MSPQADPGLPPRPASLGNVLRRCLVGLCALALGGGVLWCAFFGAFDDQVRRKGHAPPDADGIVVLTGGADRVDMALRLLAEGRAPLLLVSGVGPGAELGMMLRHAAAGADADAEARAGLAAGLDGRVTLGREAASTLGNAQETAAWVQAHAVRRLIVVTAGYHMPRALLELERALPGVTLYPAPVQPPALRSARGLGTMRLLATEFDKLLAVRLKLGRQLMEVF